MTEPLTITDAAPLIRSGELTPSELLEQCLQRIDIYEPAVKAWVYLDRERARQEAEELTKELKAGTYRGELHGIPIGIKDIIDVYDMPTGCGSKLWANSYARQDAECVKRLRQAGALILGKTVTTPYAFTDPPVTRNPWNLERTPGGSSSGSAAAVACGMCLAALGTQTGGSLTRPASYCGVCSLKPTYGRVSVSGVLPLAPSLDHVGVMANCVRDLVLIDQVLAYSLRDRELPEVHIRSLLQNPNRLLVRSFEFGCQLQVAEGLSLDKCDSRVRDLYCSFLQELANKAKWERGVFIIDLPSGMADIPEYHRIMMSVEAATVHRDRISRHPEDYPPNITALIEAGLRADATTLAKAYASSHSREITRELSNAMLWGVLLTPATSSLPPPPETTGDPVMNAPWSFLQVPTVSVPISDATDGHALSVQLIGSGRLEEQRVLFAAAELENFLALPRRLPPVPALTRGS